jgi:hypothetical protein
MTQLGCTDEWSAVTVRTTERQCATSCRAVGDVG